ncbi:oligosaccharide flippase family protein [uncultured Sunxiuqinia sp.]|uniref:lipopolysaccharide biosynthesis protein n=1 Tax=uncultured Sunxiuqinia sp. TaxID=1573825 RepID=UPI002629088B|nr:oligosaccharide flippase family protein [uncultured Sunxiuqinia sp.]
MIVKELLSRLTLKGDSRGSKAKRQILYSFLLQGLSVLIGLLYIPLLLDYLTQEKYGIWLTLTSILGWFSFFDIGLGNGLRNKLAEAIARDDVALGQKYVSTTYALLIGIFGIVLVLFHGCNFFLNWNSILNTQGIESEELYVLTSIVFTFFILRFIVQLISVIYLADQLPSITKLMTTSGNLLSFMLVLFLTTFTAQGNLVLLGTIISVIPVILFVIVSFIAFNGRYKAFRPRISKIDFKLSNGLMNLGAKFFFLQVTAIIIFSTSNVFITQFYGPEEVVVYNIAYKYFQVPIMVFSIVMTPIWSAVTDAYTKSDFSWLKNTLRQLNILALIFALGVIVMVFISDWVYELWVGDQVKVPLSLSVVLAVYTIMYLMMAPYSHYINGTGKIKLTMTLAFAGIPIYLILVFVFGDLFTNSTGIVLAITLSSLLGLVIQPMQTYKILNKKATGIWNK